MSVTNNIFINYYLNLFERKLQNTKSIKIIITNYLVVSIYVLFISKYISNLFTEYTYQAKLLTFDIPLLIGGIQIYSTIITILSLIFGLILYLRYHVIKGSNDIIVVQIWHNIMLSNNPVPESLANHDKQIIVKINSLLKIYLKFMNAISVIICK